MALFRASHHPLLVRHRYAEPLLATISAACERSGMFCVASGASPAAGTCPVDSLRHCSDLRIHQICAAVPELRALALPAAAFHDSAKVAALSRVLGAAPPGAAHGVVIASAFSSALDLVAAALGDAVPHARVDASVGEDAAAAAARRFAAGSVHVLLLQQEAALRLPELDLSRAAECVFFDSGVNVAVRPLATLGSAGCNPVSCTCCCWCVIKHQLCRRGAAVRLLTCMLAHLLRSFGCVNRGADTVSARLQAEHAVEACCLSISKTALTTFHRFVATGTVDERVAELRAARPPSGTSRESSAPTDTRSSRAPTVAVTTPSASGEEGASHANSLALLRHAVRLELQAVAGAAQPVA